MGPDSRGPTSFFDPIFSTLSMGRGKPGDPTDVRYCICPVSAVSVTPAYGHEYYTVSRNPDGEPFGLGSDGALLEAVGRAERAA
jgi:hypothetical protein